MTRPTVPDIRVLVVDDQQVIRDGLASLLPLLGGIEVVERGEDTVEVVATLVATAVAGAELDAVVAGLARMPGIEHATWSVQTAD